MVKRYMQHGYGDMWECDQAPEGEPLYVLASDYDALAAELAAEKMQHSVTIADEHESRSEFQDRIRSLEAALRECVDSYYAVTDIQTPDHARKYKAMKAGRSLLTPSETFMGIGVVVDPSMPPGTVELRGAHPTIRVEGLATAETKGDASG